MPKKAKSKPNKEAKKEEETICCGIKNHKNVVLIVSVAIIVVLVLLFTNKAAPEFEETLTPTVEQVEEVQEEPEPEVIVQDKLYEITDNKVKVLKSECPNVQAGTLGSLEQQKELYDDCGIACEETGFTRFTGNKYCDTNKDLICYCLEE